MAEHMRTRSQGLPESPIMECGTNPFPNPEQIARDQAEAVRLASIATGKEEGLLTRNTQNTTVNDSETSEIPPIDTQGHIDEGITQETGENSPDTQDNVVGREGVGITGEIPPGQGQELVATEPQEQVINKSGTPCRLPKVEDTSREDSVRSPTDLIHDVVEGQQFLDDNLSDVMRNSAIASNLSSLLNITNTMAQRQERTITMDWILPDGLNSKLEDLEYKEIADFPVPGTNHGAMLVHIPNIQPYFNMSKFLVDLHTGDLLAQIQGKWYRLEVGCRRTGFVTENLTTLLEHAGARLRKQLQPVDTDQTRILHLDPTQAKAPPIPQIPNIHNYQPHNIVMSPTTRKNYIKDRMQVAVTYITEYSNTRLWQLEDKVLPESLTQRLQIVFGRTNAVREAVD